VQCLCSQRRDEEQEIGEAFAALIKELPDVFRDSP
jgi:hypothetical protein